MSYAIAKPQHPSSSIGDGAEPPSSATVYDFICLFSHDLRRKQKRWQDGKLKYHTFNKRVMVYDDRGHFVGDAHWDQDGDLAPGDEFTLDRGNAVVQVEDCTGEKQQDLTELLDKRAREVEKRRQIAASKTRRTPASSVAASLPEQNQPQQTPARHRPHIPLSNIVQSPGGIGRAVIPAHSPYEARQQALQQGAASAAAPARAPPARQKRRSVSPPSKAGHAKSLFGATLSLSACPGPELLAARARALREKRNVQMQVDVVEVEKDRAERAITVESSPDVEDATAPENFQREKPRAQKPVARPGIGTARAVMEDAATAKIQRQRHTAAEAQESDDENSHVAIAPSKTKHAKEKQTSKKKRQAVEHSAADTDEESVSVNREVTQRKQSKEMRKSADQWAVDSDGETATVARDESPPKQTKKKKKSLLTDRQLAVDEEPATVTQETQPKKPKKKKRQTTDQQPPEDDVELHRKQFKKKKHKPSPPPPSPEEPKEVEAPKERRTELRIRARKRRGLLMMQERFSMPPRDATPLQTEPVVEEVQVPSSQPQPEAELVPPPRESTPDEQVAADSPSYSIVAGTPPEISSEQDIPRVRRRKRARNQDDDDDSGDDVADRPVQKSPSPERPRIAKLPRKGIKSREIIGYVHRQNEALVPEPFAASVTAVLPAVPPLPLEEVVDNTVVQSVEEVEVIEQLEAVEESEGVGVEAIAKLEPVEELEPIEKLEPIEDLQPIAELEPIQDLEAAEKGKQPDDIAEDEVLREEARKPMPDAGKDHEPAQTIADTELPREQTDSLTTTLENHDGSARSNISPESENGIDDNVAIVKPRIINPATRGRKAARKEDAAGQAPQTLVPFEPVMPGVRISTRPAVVVVKDTGSASLAPRRIASGGGSGATKQLPGFSRGSGGAWSEHAQDLLGMGRPE